MIWTILLTVSVSSLSFALQKENECPRKEDINPCNYCEVYRGGIYIKCYPKHVNELRKAFANLRGNKHIHIQIDGFWMEKIPFDLFKGLDVIRLDLYDVERIGEEGRSSFEGLEDTLERLYIWGNRVKKQLKVLNITAMNVLDTFDIVLYEVPTLENDFFAKYPVNLQNLHIRSQQTCEIGDKVFEKFVNLRFLTFLTVTNTMFGDFRRSMFPSPASYLGQLDISDNRISSLPEDIFVNMPSLYLVDLTGNRIARLPEATWSAVWSQLDILYLDDNPLECDDHIEWIFRIRRPASLRGTCESPEYYKGKELKTIIEENIKF